MHMHMHMRMAVGCEWEVERQLTSERRLLTFYLLRLAGRRCAAWFLKNKYRFPSSSLRWLTVKDRRCPASARPAAMTRSASLPSSLSSSSCSCCLRRRRKLGVRCAPALAARARLPHGAAAQASPRCGQATTMSVCGPTTSQPGRALAQSSPQPDALTARVGGSRRPVGGAHPVDLSVVKGELLARADASRRHEVDAPTRAAGQDDRTRPTVTMLGVVDEATEMRRAPPVDVQAGPIA